MTSNRFELIETLSSLYELSLSIGNSFEPEENSDAFLRSLMQQQQLSYAGFFRFESSTVLQTIQTIPKNARTTFKFSQEFAHFVQHKSQNILDQNDPLFPELTQLSLENYKHYCYFFIGTKGLIVLARNQTPFSKIETMKNHLIMNKFGLFMESLESHHQIKREIEIKNQQALIIKENNQKLKEQNEELRRYIHSNNELEKFAHRTSHDLKAPLGTIMGFTDLLKNSQQEFTKRDMKFIEMIQNGATQMQDLIDGILEYSRANGIEVNYQEVDLNALLSKVKLMLYDSLLKVDGQLEFQNLPSKIYADQTKLSQLFLNLLSNALKFSRKDVQAKIVISSVENDDSTQISIADNGIGIKEENLSKIFDVFTRINSNKDYLGSGIGLSTCKEIVNQHGGEIWAESQFGSGTTFHFTLAKK